MIVSGLTAMPVSTADVARLNLAVIIHFGLDHGGDKAAEGRLHAHAAADARRQRLVRKFPQLCLP
jgi:hypothetical protein